MMKILVAMVGLVAAVPAFASAATLFRDGKFTEAAAAGRVENTASSLVLAGRAELIIASFDTVDHDRAKALVDAADRDFDAALVLAPNNIEAQLQKATATGYKGKLAKSPGLVKETRTRMEAVLARDPQYGLAWASLGGWHAAGVATLGKFLAGTLLGANTKVAISDFETAQAKDPRNPVQTAFYGLTLLDLGTDNAPRALQLLQSLSRMPTRDAYESQLKAATASVVPLITSGDVRAAQTLARRLLPFGKLT